MDKVSYLKLNSDEVTIACKSYLKFRRKRIEKEKEELIQKYMVKRTFFKSTSYEEAVAKAHHDHEWNYIEITGGASAQKVEELLVAASGSRDGDILVASDVFALISRHMPDRQFTPEPSWVIN